MNSTRVISLAFLAAVAGLSGCSDDMDVQPRRETFAPDTFFKDGRSARPFVEGTIARGQLRLDGFLYTGKTNGVFVTQFPFPITRATLERGRERYDVFCAPCHDRTGSGAGMVVRRGFRPPESLHTERLRNVPVGQLYDAIARGVGLMLSQSDQIPVEDRWAIVAYMRALQLSQHARRAELPPEQAKQLGGTP